MYKTDPRDPQERPSDRPDQPNSAAGLTREDITRLLKGPGLLYGHTSIQLVLRSMDVLQAFPLRALINNKMESKNLHEMTLLKIHFSQSVWYFAKQAENVAEEEGGKENHGSSPRV